MIIDVFPPFSDFFGVPRLPWRAAVLRECPSSGGATGEEGVRTFDFAGAVHPELRHLQRREQRPAARGTHPAGTDWAQ